MNVYRIVVPDVEYETDIGLDDCKLVEIDAACCLVLAETNAKARYRGLKILCLGPGQYEKGWPDNVSCVCTHKNVDFPGMYDGMDVSDHLEWWRTAKEKERDDAEVREVQRETVGEGDLC
jgi:hypothetical protein